MKRVILGVAAFAVAAAVLWWFVLRDDDGAGTGALQIETAELVRRDLERVVASSGRIAPLVTVEVGSQLSGQILELNADFNDEVEAGALLARLDPQSFETRVLEAEASAEVARAQVQVSQANVARTQSELAAAERAFARAEELRQRGTFSEAQYDQAQTAFDNARAGLAVANANLRNARATLQQREASLQSARVDLERTFIRSPIDGVVIDRQIDEGQTVAASFNAPVLFLIAQDLTRVQIEAQIDESDIGQIETGQNVTFDVDAYPGLDFEGDVTQVRLAAADEGNVVTYTVVIEADNPRQRLLPGMTANVSIVTGRVESALAAPNAALRFAPRGAAASLVAEGSEAPQDGGERRGGGAQGIDAMVDRMAETLDLTDAQTSEVRDALTEAFAQVRAQMQASGGAGGPPDMRAVMRRALASVLTEAQLDRWEALSAERRSTRPEDTRPGTLWVETADGRLESRAVRLGLSDGQYTQILTDALEAGDAAVVRVREDG